METLENSKVSPDICPDIRGEEEMTKTIRFAEIVIAVALGVLPSGCSESSDQQPTQPSTQPAKELTLDLGNKVTMKLILIPPGKFMMGSPEGERLKAAEELKRVLKLDEPVAEIVKWMADEGPQHEVTITKPFYMGVYEVTQEQYEQIIGKNPSSFKGVKNPVDTVSWDDAGEFCKKLSAKTGKTVSLPTEAQWEYACRAGTKTRFGYGDNDADLGGYAWDSSNSDSKTHPVGSFKPNAFGLYDMHGNVWERCGDWYAASYANAKNQDPTGPDSGTYRVLRGGGWDGGPLNCRSANRTRISSDARDDSVGFRVAVDLK
jgi:formylglycine-generating enzyme required for sulfatase activity